MSVCFCVISEQCLFFFALLAHFFNFSFEIFNVAAANAMPRHTLTSFLLYLFPPPIFSFTSPTPFHSFS